MVCILGYLMCIRAVTGTTETTDTAVDNGNKQDGNTVSVEQKGLDKPLYILVVGTDDNNPSQSDSLFCYPINLDQNNGCYWHS